MNADNRELRQMSFEYVFMGVIIFLQTAASIYALLRESASVIWVAMEIMRQRRFNRFVAAARM
jgi:hypothetical protein